MKKVYVLLVGEKVKHLFFLVSMLHNNN